MNMANLTNDYDKEYSIKSAPSDVFYKKDNDKVVNKPSLILKITRKTALTVKSLKWLRKNGFLNNWSYFRILFNKKVESSRLLIALYMTITALSCFTGLVGIFSGAYIGTLILLSFTAALLVYFANYSDTLLKNKLPKELKEQTHQIIIDQDNELLYGLTKSINQYKFTHVETQKLFNIIEEYPCEVNEKIHKLVQLKEKLPTDTKDTNNNDYSIFQDTDKLLDELFELRDSQKNKAILNKVESIFKSSVDRQKLEKLGVSVEELSEVSEFLEKMKRTNSSSSISVVASQQDIDVLEAMNNTSNTTDEEIFNEAPSRRTTRNTTTKIS